MDSNSLEEINQKVLYGITSEHKKMFCVVGGTLIVSLIVYVIYRLHQKRNKKEKQD